MTITFNRIISLGAALLLINTGCASTSNTYSKKTGDKVEVYSKVDPDLSAKSEGDRESFNSSIEKLKVRITKNPKDADAHINLSQLLVFSGKLNDAESEAMKGLKLLPGQQNALLVLAQIEFARKNYDAAEFMLNRLTDDKSIGGRALVLKGLLLLERNDPTEAAIAFRAAIAKDGGNIAGRMNLGVVYIEFNQFKLASEQFEAVLKIIPDHVDAKLHLAIACSVLGNHERADSLYEDVLKARRGNAVVVYNRAINYEKMGKLAESLGSFNKVTESEDLNDSQKEFAKDMIRVLSVKIAQIEKAKRDREQQEENERRRAQQPPTGKPPVTAH